MPPKRRTEKPRSAPQKPPSAPPPPPPEPDATKVRREWSRFIDEWYEPQRTKLVEKLQKDLLVKYKNLGSAQETQKLREMELFEKLDAIAQQLADPARAEWARRLELAHLREDQWDDMSGEEQQAVLSVFVGFFDLADMDGDHLAPIDQDTTEVRAMQPPPSKLPIPPTPTRHTFECVNPTSFFADSMTPPNPTKNLPALSMDHLQTLGPSNPARSAEPLSATAVGIPGFHNWASEAGIASQPSKPSVTSTPSAHTLTTRPRATDMSRQASAASTTSPHSKPISPQYSPQNNSTKFSPPINAEHLPLGKRYIGPVILDEDPDPVEEELLKSRMADEYQQYKVSLRIQMIYEFHAEAAEVEIKLVESLSADDGTKESRARAVQVHESSMMRLRDLKEEERKRLCAEEREKRREEMRQHLAQRRQTQDAEPGPKSYSPRPPPDKPSVQQRPGKATHQKENVPLSQPPLPSSSKLDPPSIIKKSNSSLSQDEASANEALFANAMAMMTQGKPGAGVLTSAQASLNEALFANAAATLATQAQPGPTGKNAVQPPSIMKKSNSSRSQEQNVPQITVSFADPPVAVVSEPTQVPHATAKGKKGKKGQQAAQIPPAKLVAVTEEPRVEMDAEPPPPSSLWGVATVAAKTVLGVASASLSTPAVKFTPMEEERDPEPLTAAPALSRGHVSSKKPTPSSKKGKKVTITEEPDVDADPVISPLKTKAPKSAWGSVNGKSRVTPPVVEDNASEPSPPPPPAAPVRGKKAAEATAKSCQKPQLKVTISEEQKTELEPSPVPPRASKAKPTAVSSAQEAKKTAQQQAVPRHGIPTSGSESARVRDSEDGWLEMVANESTVPGALASTGPEGAEDDEEGDASVWFNPENMSYWANFMAGQPEAEETEAEETETETQAPPPIEQTGKHVRWTPTMNEESDDEGMLGGGVDEELATSMWVQYAINGGDIPEEPRTMLAGITQHDTSPWEQGTGKKLLNPLNPNTGDLGNRAQQTSVFDRAALTGQWPKMDSWLSPPSRGQNSGSTRVF